MGVGNYQKQEWWLVRHAPVPLKTLYGQMDVAADFSDQAAFSRLADRMPKFGSVYASDLSRCVGTAEQLLRRMGQDSAGLHTRAAFREQNFGDWQGLTYDQTAQLDSAAYAAFWDDPVDNAPPGGESFKTLSARVCQARSDVSDLETEGPVLLVTHAGVIRALLAAALGLADAHILSLGVDPLSCSKITLFRQDGVESWGVDWINRI